MKNKHMTLDDRIEIQECLAKGISFKDIGKRNFIQRHWQKNLQKCNHNLARSKTTSSSSQQWIY